MNFDRPPDRRSGKTRFFSAHFVVVDLLVIAALLLGGVGGIVFDRKVLVEFRPLPQIPKEARDDFRLMAEAWNTIMNFYAEASALDKKSMAYGAIKGMVDSLGDPNHSQFLTPDMVEQMRKAMSGRFVGVGIELQTKNGEATVVAPIDGSPAEKAGIQPGDVIEAVDGKPVRNLSLEQIVGLVHGKTGTHVRLTMRKARTGQTKEYDLLRATIVPRHVTWTYVPGTSIAHVRVADFSKGVTGLFEETLARFKNRPPAGIILDLRNNPGGLLDEAVGIASQFLSKGLVAQVKSRDGQITPVAVRDGGHALTVPVVVLVNQGTASAAEIVAAALHAAGRAGLVGVKTFGTGTVLRQFSLSDGSALLLAIREWLTPDGKTIWHEGIEPDQEVALPEDLTPLRPTEERGMTRAALEASGDAQLLAGLKRLEGRQR